MLANLRVFMPGELREWLAILLRIEIAHGHGRVPQQAGILGSRNGGLVELVAESRFIQ